MIEGQDAGSAAADRAGDYAGLPADQRIEAVARLWEAHLRAPFPPRLRGLDIAGVEMILLDADIAGCVSVWLDSNGQLDDWRRTAVASCLRQLDLVQPLLAGQEAAYYRRLRDLAELIA
ncbi:hypothetical protein [Micromonospora sp. NPDC047738]|uniref:hypothetical protein n=1 Tax=unclassified Micromonospora TaxID=2617518 RepID=UPI0033F6333F